MKKNQNNDEEIRLNRFLAMSGVASRRQADEYIASGLVRVNQIVVTELGTKIKRTDKVYFRNKEVQPERHQYILLNKPKDTVTTAKDPQGRRTVIDMIKNACEERVYPVGRLDRNTTGILLLTNDGDLAAKLSHPSSSVSKLYHVKTDRPVSKNDLIRLTRGVELEDGLAKADEAKYVEEAQDEIGIRLHSGKNRVIRRMFEKLDYRIVKLDRVEFAGLTKKNLARGQYRFLSNREVNFLKLMKK